MPRQSNSAQSASTPRRTVKAELTRPREMPIVSHEDMFGDRFFRHLVFNLRTGVLAITRQGRVAAMNDLAYRVLGLTIRAGDIGRPFTEVLETHLCFLRFKLRLRSRLR